MVSGWIMRSEGQRRPVRSSTMARERPPTYTRICIVDQCTRVLPLWKQYNKPKYTNSITWPQTFPFSPCVLSIYRFQWCYILNGGHSFATYSASSEQNETKDTNTRRETGVIFCFCYTYMLTLKCSIELWGYVREKFCDSFCVPRDFRGFSNTLWTVLLQERNKAFFMKFFTYDFGK